MSKYFYFILCFFVIGLSAKSIAQDTLFIANFDNYTSGQQLVCQDTINWNTWSNAPCGAEDPMVTNAFSSSAPNAVLVLQNDDLVKILPNYTDGDYSISFSFYIPSGKSGYFNLLHVFGASPNWAFEVYLDPDSTGTVNAGGTNAATFTYMQDQWNTVEVRVSMEGSNDIGAFDLNGTSVHTWTWSAGATGSGGIKQLGGINIFGAEATQEMYFDDLMIIEITGTTDVEDFTSGPVEFELNQNYPNPFNPSTQIVYNIPEAGFVNLTIFNTLGEQVAVLVNGHREAGTYNYTFNAENLPSGAYVYRLTAGDRVSAKKMILSK